MRPKLVLSSLLTISALLGVTACATDEDLPDQGDHDQVGSGATCGSCDPADERVNDDGTVDVCGPCDEGEIVAPQDVPSDPIVVGGGGGGAGSAVLARVPPAGSSTPQQCKADWERALALCDAAKRAGNLACDSLYQGRLDSCIQGVYQRCGTTSEYHVCVIEGRRQCVASSAAALQACNSTVESAHQRCRAEATIDYYDCRAPSTGTGGIYRLWRRHNPF